MIDADESLCFPRDCVDEEDAESIGAGSPWHTTRVTETLEKLFLTIPYPSHEPSRGVAFGPLSGPQCSNSPSNGQSMWLGVDFLNQWCVNLTKL